MDVMPESNWSGTKAKLSSKVRNRLFTQMTTLNTQGTASDKQGNQSRCGPGRVHANAKIRVCPACSANHLLMKCQNFERKTFGERVQIMRKAQVCQNCFQYGHIARGCLTKGVYQVDGCKRRHHTLLHPPYQQGSNVNQASEESVTQTTQIQASLDARATQATSRTPTQGGQSNTTLARSSKVCLKIVPVKVHSRHSNKELFTYALLDNGSDVSLCA